LTFFSDYNNKERERDSYCKADTVYIYIYKRGIPSIEESDKMTPTSSHHKIIKKKNTLFEGFIRHAMHDRDSRRVCAFLAINFAFMFVEVFTGLLTNSLGLLSDAGHMFFDCTSLFISLGAAYISAWPADERFPKGYAKVEVLAGYTNAVLLVIIAMTILCEAMHRCFDPENHHHHEHLLLPVSVGGLFVNVVGLMFFHEHHSHSHHRCSHSNRGHSPPRTSTTTSCSHAHSHGHSHHSHGHNNNIDHHNETERRIGHSNNMHGVFLHILADTLGSVGVVVSSYLIKNYGWRLADPLCAIIISALILASTWPLLRDTSLSLILHKDKDSVV
jgi:solute carrier family 30 (zinc transporter), member 5/7